MEQTLVDGRYALSSLLGSGGMGKVYHARDGVLGRDVALKLLREHYAEDEEFVERFRREAQNAASLSHPNIVAVYDWGRAENGAYYMAMEYVPGATLKDRVEAEGPLEAREAARLGAEVAEALGAAHGRDLVHRDVKPQNVLLSAPRGDGQASAKVADFGIARAANATTLTRTSHVLGTARYMSPEQALGKGVGPASDLYSLGVVLFEVLTGDPLYDADGPITLAMKHVNEPPRPPREANPGVPEVMDAIVLKLLAKDPEDRYASAGELAEDLRRAHDDLPEALPGGERPGTGTAAPIPVAVPEDPDERERAGEATRVLGAHPGPGEGGAPNRGARRRKPAWVVAALLAVVLALLGTAALDPFGSTEGSARAAQDAIRSLQGSSGGAPDRQEANVPDLVGLPAKEARERLGEVGFEAVLKPRESSEGDVGKVLDQSVPGGKRVEEGSRVVLGVGEGPRLVEAPDLSRLTLDEAGDALEEAGLTLGGMDGAPSEDVPAGTVVGQDPAAEEEVKRGAAVRLTLSSGPKAPADVPDPAVSDPEAGSDASAPAAEEPLAVPDVFSVGVEEATRVLAAAGCSVSGTTEVSSPEPAGTVLGTDPPVGTAVEPGTPVTLVVSAGPPPEEPAAVDASGQYQYAPDEDPGANAAPAAPAPPYEPAPAERATEPAAYDEGYPEDEAGDQYEDLEPED